MFYDNPRIVYENPPPPTEDFEYDNEPIFFTIRKPRRVKGVKIITIDPSLINLAFHGFNEKDEKQNFTDTDCLEKREKGSLPETVCTEKPKQNLTQRHENTKDNKNMESIKAETGLNTLEEKIEGRKLEKKLVAIPESFDYASNDYYCNVCKINLNSLSVYSAHMKGKRHKKAVKLLTERQLHKTPVLEVIEPKTHTRQTEIVRVQLRGQESKIQNLCDDAHLPILGLNYVKEIRGSEIKYYCDLCSAQFIEKKIMDHLVGIEHQMNCLKKYSPQIYRWIKHHSHDSRRVEKELKLRLEEIKINHGIGQIRVFKDVERKPVSPEPYDPYQPSTSRHGLNVPEQNAEYVGRSNELRVTDEECLSRDYSDFYCKVCDSHMNTYSTWESHVSGKRHAKNKTKSSKDIEKTNNFIEAPYGTISHLEQLITDQCDTDAIIVGLNFIQENHGEIGNQYNCFLCGGVYPSAEIINHLNLLKHKQRYLEKMFDDGHNNAINNIKSLRIGQLSKEALIDSECITMLKEFGPGKPIIYQLKDF